MLDSAPKASSQDSTNAIRILIAGIERSEADSDLGNRLFQEQLEKLRSFMIACKSLEHLLEKKLQKVGNNK